MAFTQNTWLFYNVPVPTYLFAPTRGLRDIIYIAQVVRVNLASYDLLVYSVDTATTPNFMSDVDKTWAETSFTPLTVGAYVLPLIYEVNQIVTFDPAVQIGLQQFAHDSGLFQWRGVVIAVLELRDSGSAPEDSYQYVIAFGNDGQYYLGFEGSFTVLNEALTPE